MGTRVRRNTELFNVKTIGRKIDENEPGQICLKAADTFRTRQIPDPFKDIYNAWPEQTAAAGAIKWIILEPAFPPYASMR
jgi:hypothetical protein